MQLANGSIKFKYPLRIVIGSFGILIYSIYSHLLQSICKTTSSYHPNFPKVLAG